MKKKLFLLIATFTVIISSLSFYQFNSNKVEAATIGKQLIKPEEGWKRYDDTDPAIVRNGNYWKYYPESTDRYGGGIWGSQSADSSITFIIYSTSLRLLDAIYSDRDVNDIEIEIDGESEVFNTNNKIRVEQALVYEKKGLSKGFHKVTIKKIGKGTGFLSFDALDIDSDGRLLLPDETIAESLKLNKSSVNLSVGSSEALVATIIPEEVTNKNIKWTSSNPEIATVDDSGNVIGKSPGKVTITAETTDGSNLKATAEVTVKEVEVEGNKGILKLTSTTGDLHEYDLSRTEINNFIAWLDKKGEGKPYYEFKLNVTTGNIKSRTEYIMFDEIVSFVIDEY